MSKILANLIMKLRPKRDPDFLIGPDENDPYMRRWWIIPRNKWFNIYLHNMLHDDDDRAPHDHPWWSLSLCLHGRIKEHQLLDVYPIDDIVTYDYDYVDDNSRRYKINDIYAGDWKYRDSKYVHRLELPDGEAWTLFMTGPNIRTWGFWCPKGFVPWKKFVNPEKPGQPGRGCGEME